MYRFMFYPVLLIFLLTNGQAVAQEAPKKVPIYASVAMGYGNTFFYGSLSEKETINDSRGYGRNQGYTLSTFFYAAPEHWRGLGIGSGVKGFFATPNNGGNDETYLFNTYHVGVLAKGSRV